MARTNVEKVKVYKLRNDLVLIRKKKAGERRSGLVLPERSAEGMVFYVEAHGPDVKDLKIGDRVMIMGKANSDDPQQNIYPVPGDPELFIVYQRAVAYTFTEVDKTEEQTAEVA